MAKRVFDIIFCSFLVVIFSVPMCIIAVLVKCSSRGPVLFWSERVGQNNKIFQMPKFRTMRTETPLVATHLLEDPNIFVTPIGRFLRRTSADELPQLISIIYGQMSLVGPRPALPSQDDLIHLRTIKGIHRLRPGLTGYAQVRGRDEVSVAEKADLDEEYLAKQSMVEDLKITLATVIQVVGSKDISH